jgi:hypothetical protein
MVAKRLKRESLGRRLKTRRGRPRVHSESWSKVTVVLLDRQIVRLDRLAANIKHQTGTILNRAALIRSVIDALFDSHVDVNGVESEPELRVRLAERLRR